jgi:hypothetical protein
MLQQALSANRRWPVRLRQLPTRLLSAAAIQGRTAHGPKAGAHDVRPGRGSRQEPVVQRPLAAELDGFSLHAAVRIPQGCRGQLERLCRYAARPPVAEERLSLLPDGRVHYKLKRRWRDGSTSVVLDPCTLIERLCALVPRPRQMLMTYHGVLAPAAGYRHRVVPPPLLPDADDPEGCPAPATTRGSHPAPGPDQKIRMTPAFVNPPKAPATVKSKTRAWIATIAPATAGSFGICTG